MNSMQKLINCNKQIYNNAVKRRGNPNVLIDTLLSDIKYYNTTGLADIITKILLDSRLTINKHKINLVSNNQECYTCVKHHKNGWMIKSVIPVHIGKLVKTIKYHYAKYEDVILLSQRCDCILHKLYQWYVPNTSTTSLLTYLDKLSRFIQHGFINDALDELFKGTYLDTIHNQLQFTTYLAYLADQAVAKHPYKIINHDKYVMCCNIDDMLCGNDNIIKQLHLKSADIKKIKSNKTKLKHIKQNGVKYLVVTVDKYNPFACTLKPVDKKNGLEIIQAVKKEVYVNNK